MPLKRRKGGILLPRAQMGTEMEGIENERGRVLVKIMIDES